MRYKTITIADANLFAREITDDPSKRTLDYAVQFASTNMRPASTPGSGNEVELDVSAIELLADDIQGKIDAIRRKSKKASELEALEGEVCGDIHRALIGVPVEILDDSGFWRYVAIGYFSDFILFREESALAKGNIGTYFSAQSGAESIPLRLFIRAQSMLDSRGGYDLASSVDKGTDFWRSHIVRVRTGRAKELAQAFAKMQSVDPMKTDLLRKVARRLNRQWSNVVLFDYDYKKATQLIKDIRKSVD